MFHKILQHRSYRYILIGGSVYLLEMIVITVAQTFGATAVTAVAISFLVGVIASFLLQKFVAFDDKRTQHHILIPQVIAFALLVLFNFGFTLFVTDILASSLPTTIARTLALGATTIWNFYLYKTRIFKTNQSPLY